MEQVNVDDLKFVNRIYRYIKNDMPVETFKAKFNVNDSELNGILELCKIYGKNLSLIVKDNVLVFQKGSVVKSSQTSKPFINDGKLKHNQILVVSDTHFGNVHQQAHLLNEAYQEAYNRGITTAFHCGDITDGTYYERKENPRQQFLHGFDEQVGYAVDMYPKVDGMKTYYILGSHDETAYKNGQATLDYWIGKCRDDMVFLGQDTGNITIDGVKYTLDHPGGGSAQAVSYKPQKRIEIIEAKNKPNVLLIGHYHKSYAFNYRNVQCVEVPSLCDKTQFQQKQGLLNAMGYYFLDVYSDQNGNIEYFEPEEVLYGQKDVWDEAGKDKKKVKQLVIKDGKY